MAGVLGDIESYRIGSKGENKNILIDIEDHRKNKHENKQRRKYGERSEVFQTCTFLFLLVLEFGVYHTNKFKLKGLRFLLRFLGGIRKFEGVPKGSGTCGGCY